MGVGFLGAMRGLGEAGSEIGSSWMNEAKEKRISELRAKLTGEQRSADQAWDKERDETKFQQGMELAGEKDRLQTERDQTKFQRGLELEGEKSKLLMARDEAKAKRDKELLSMKEDSRTDTGGKVGGYTEKELDTRIGSTVATGQKMNVDGLDWDTDKEQNYARVSAAVREQFVKDPSLGVIGAYNMVVNPTTPLTEADVPEDKGIHKIDRSGKPAPSIIKDEDMEATIGQVKTLLDQGQSEEALKAHAIRKGMPAWQADLMIEEARRSQ